MTGSKSPSDPPAPPGRTPVARARSAGALAALLAAMLFHLIAPGGSERLFDLYQRIAPWNAPAPVAQVVLIDPESLKAIGPWPWPRYTLARLTERIGAAGATAIGFDMLFPEPDRYNPDHFAALYPELSAGGQAALAGLPSMDTVFATVIGQHPVVLARSGLMPGTTDFDVAAGVDAAGLPVEAAFDGALPGGVTAYPRALANIADLDEVAAGQALINGPPDRDGVVRQVPLLASVAGVATPGFAMELARIGSGAAAVTPVIAHGRLTSVRLGRHALPVAPDGRMRVPFGPMPVGSVISARTVLQRGLPADRFAGRIVLIGLAAAGTADVVTTPIDPETYGVYVQARAVDAIVAGRALDRPWRAPWGETAAGAMLALLILWALPRLRLPWAVVLPVAGLALLIAVSWIAFRAAGLLIDPIRPIAIAGGGAAGLLAALFVESGWAQRRLRAALEVQRLSAAKAAGELDAARDIQLGMLPQRDRLHAIDPAVDLDALLEPARSVGGDFFDAMRLGDHHICFLVGDVTGKGVPAALFMALSKALARSVLRRRPDDLGAALTELNEEISRDNGQDMFVTMLVGILDVRTGDVALCNAGHENPLRVTSAGVVEELTLEGGPPLCAADGFPYTAEPIRLAPGEGLVIVTDGVTEAQDPDGDFFGHHRLLDVLAGWVGSEPASAAGDALLKAVRSFEAGGEPSDDVTVLALRYRGPA